MGPFPKDGATSGDMPGTTRINACPNCIVHFVLKAELAISRQHPSVVVVNLSPHRKGKFIEQGYLITISPGITALRQNERVAEFSRVDGRCGQPVEIQVASSVDFGNMGVRQHEVIDPEVVHIFREPLVATLIVTDRVYVVAGGSVGITLVNAV